jgi:hypothetical protein
MNQAWSEPDRRDEADWRVKMPGVAASDRPAPSDAEADALMRKRLERFHTDLAALKAIRR